jgi:hypothetical protein
MTHTRLSRPQVLVLAWAVTSYLVALLPAGAGGLPRVVNGVLFMTLGPACALGLALTRRFPAGVATVMAIAGSLATLLVSSQLLLVLGLWSAWRVAALVTWVTMALVLATADYPSRKVD